MKYVLFSLCILLFWPAGAQLLNPDMNDGDFFMKERQMMSEMPYKRSLNNYAAKATAGPIFDTTKWASAIDAAWGPGISTVEKLKVFDSFWEKIDSNYACFVQLPLYKWDSIVSAMRAEISMGVSKGRFAGIISQLLYYINDGHTYFRDKSIGYGVSGGAPVFVGESGAYGACITMQKDSSALVYSAVAGHPFGLERGDIILGYNNIPWKSLVATFLRHRVPIRVPIGSSPEATYHYFVRAALENWYMFDTIDIRKCDGSVIHKSTSLMKTLPVCFCTEQMPVPGVHQMTYVDYYTNMRKTTYGLIKGTHIGYVAFYDCMDKTGDSLLTAVKRLVEDSLADGLVIDIRTNGGGTFLAYYNTFKYLSNGDATYLGWAKRATPTDRYKMTNDPYSYDVLDTMAHHYDKKIALLTGPWALSAGDVLPVMFTRLPNLKTFGKSTAGAFGSITYLTLPDSGYYAAMQNGNFFDPVNPAYYLSHTSYPVDSQVWFEQASVCKGEDNILRAAMLWIEPKLDIANIQDAAVSLKVYPNPSRNSFNIALNSITAGDMQIRLLNMMGTELLRLHTRLAEGENEILMDLSDRQVPPGLYLLEVTGNGIGQVTRKVMIAN